MKLITLASLMTLAVGAQAGTCDVHTWHDVESRDGDWKVTLKVINQQGQFVDSHCTKVQTRTISPSNKLIYGFSFAKDADFDIAYTLTAVKQSQQNFQSKACVFVITANGPAQPDVNVLSYHGAKCDWNVVHGVGENFRVS